MKNLLTHDWDNIDKNKKKLYYEMEKDKDDNMK